MIADAKAAEKKQQYLGNAPAAVTKLKAKGGDVNVLTKLEIASILLGVYEFFMDPKKSSNNKSKMVKELREDWKGFQCKD